MHLNEALTVLGLLAIAIVSMQWLPSEAKDIVISVVSGLLGYLTGRRSDGKDKEERKEAKADQAG